MTALTSNFNSTLAPPKTTKKKQVSNKKTKETNDTETSQMLKEMNEKLGEMRIEPPKART